MRICCFLAIVLAVCVTTPAKPQSAAGPRSEPTYEASYDLSAYLVAEGSPQQHQAQIPSAQSYPSTAAGYLGGSAQGSSATPYGAPNGYGTLGSSAAFAYGQSPLSSPFAAGSGAGTPFGGAGAGAAAGATDFGAAASGLGGALGGASPSALTMLGDQGPFLMRQRIRPSQATPPGQPEPPDPARPSLVVPSVRGFKIAENQSPIPQDRLFFTFNYFNNVGKQLGEYFESPITGIQYHRYTFGAEKTFDQGRGSVGLRQPVDSLYAASREPRLNAGGNSTALGNLTVFAKYVLRSDPRTGSLATAGIAVTPPTGSLTLANASFISGKNTTTVQPFFAYYLNFNKWFIHGFSAIDVPMNPSLPTMAYNDVGLVYLLYQSQQPDNSWITTIAPTFEVHVNNPLNHRSEYSLADDYGTPDIVNLTYGLNVAFGRRVVFTSGLVTPVTHPKPFDFELIGMVNILFGGRPRSGPPIVPIIGG